MIYLDNASTTVIDQEVLKSYTLFLNEYFANASAIHALGLKGQKYLTSAKEQITKILNVPSFDVIFTSGATESNNLAIKGTSFSYQNRGKTIITDSVEHSSVINAFMQLKDTFNFTIKVLNVNKDGVIDLDELALLLNDDVILVSLMSVNNEVGAINPLVEASKLIRKYPKCYFHVDDSQGLGKVSFDYNLVDLVTLSAHKIYGLKGSGILLKRKTMTLLPLLSGGGQENGQRSGTYDVAKDISFAKTIRLAKEREVEDYKYVSSLKSLLLEGLSGRDDIVINSPLISSPYIFNFSTLKVKASVLVEALSSLGIYVSSTSACNSKKEVGSYVIKAIYNDEKRSRNTIRVSLARYNTKSDIETFLKETKRLLGELR